MITSKKTSYLKQMFFCLFFFIAVIQSSTSQISFSQSNLNFNGNDNVSGGVTGMSFGPDNRLYVVEYTGAIKILTINRNSATDYNVTAIEVLDGISTIQNHNDDGSSFNINLRETIDIVVGGTAVNPIFYVSSSDIRIGAGSNGGNGDVGLDTNSGIITRFSWNGLSWDIVDIVRGLPRSEENHATNGLQLATINGKDHLIVSNGGITNGGSPSINFVYTCEYALSAAVLSIDLNKLNTLPVLNDNGRNYIYDLPTLDDPTRPNSNGIVDPDAIGYNGKDINDPFGGNDGLNMAIISPDGPVQILSPGYRNAYGVVVTESGALYVTDNGANQGWGGFPENEGTTNVNNNYNPTQPGDTSPSGGEFINNLDHLQLVTTNLNDYTFNSFYGGHPNPVRANPQGAGLYTDNSSALGTFGSPIWRTKIYDPNGSRPNSTTNPNEGLPSNWPPVQIANPVEGDWRGPSIINPDGPNDKPVVTWGTNTNSIDEYTASNFGGALKGNLLAGHNGGNIRRVILSEDGSSGTLQPNFFSGIGGDVLGLTCNGDQDIFPGTVWAGTIDGKIVVMEPLADTFVCIQPGNLDYNPLADYDNDGYTNKDESDNGTDLCNAGSQPADFDKSNGAPFISDHNDPDDDSDGIPDSEDPFQLGNPLAVGSQAFTIPVSNDLFNNQQGLGGIFGLGMTGLMNNGDTSLNWLNWIDRRDNPNDPNPNDVLGGAPGIMTSHMTSGTALGLLNNQEKAYQYGLQVNSSSDSFTIIGGMTGFSGGPYRLYGNAAAIGGELGFFIGDGTQSNYIKFVVTVNGFTVLQEINDVPQAPINVPLAEIDRPSNSIRFYFTVNPQTDSVTLDYSLDSNPRVTVATVTAQGKILEALQLTNKDLAVGFIGTSGVSGVELEGSWDFLNVIGSKPLAILALPDINKLIGANPESINLNSYFTDDSGSQALTYTVENNSNNLIGATITNNTLNFIFPQIIPAKSVITIRATDANNNFVEQSFTVNIGESLVLYRVNAGGPEITAIDNEINWSADTAVANSTFLFQAGSNSTSSFSINSTTNSVDTNKIPISIFQTERYDSSLGQPNLTYAFPVAENGNYEVRLYMGNGFQGTSQVGQRIFNATIEDNSYPELSNIDLTGRYGHQVGAVISQIVPVNDGVINITLLHNVENPLINGIEILKMPGVETPINVHDIANQTSIPGEALNGSFGVAVTGGDGNLNYTAVNLPPGLFIEPTNGQIGGTVAMNASTVNPYNVVITVDDSDAISSDAKTVSFLWTIIANFVWIDRNEDENYTARHENSFVQAGNKFYLMGGRENAKTIDVYDYTSNTWTALTNSAPFEFNHFQATEYKGLIWVIGAFQNNLYPTELPAEYIWSFDPSSNEWIQGPQIPVNRRRGSAGLAVYNDKFYILAGNTNGHDGGYVNWFDEYNPATGTWTALADAPRARDHFHTTVIGNKLYAVGGRLSGGEGGVFKPVIPQVDVYDFTTSSWSTLPINQNLPTPRAAPMVANYNGKLLVIGGEVQNELVYGVNTDDALKITEQYDPSTQSWSRLADLNYERHGSQAIVSGSGIFTLAGSPSRGGGNQKNMEVFGTDVPVGNALVASQFSAPTSMAIESGTTKEIILQVSDGNVGKIIKSVQLSGPNAADFNIVSGSFTNGLINPNSTHTIEVQLNNNSGNKSAILSISYGASSVLNIILSNTSNNDLTITNPLTQNNNEQDVISLQINATGANNLTYTATGLPPTLSINPSTGLISGTVSDGGLGVGAADNSPYNVTITVASSSNPAANEFIQFIWNIGPVGNQSPVAVASAIPLAGTAPLVVNFTGSNSTDDVAITNYLWNFGDGSATVSVSNPTHTYTSAGTYTALLTVTDAGGLQDTKNVVITVTSPTPPVNNFVLRVNAGGPAVTHNGILFEADKNFIGGNSYVNNLAQISELYKTERSSSSQIFGYNIPLPNGDYTAVLHFAEIYWGATGSGSGPLGTGRRKFDVTMEGTLILDNFDIFAEVGAQTVITKSYPVTVTDGVLNVSFSSLASLGGVDQPKLSALEILGTAAPTVNQSPVAVAIATPLTGTAPLAVSFTGSNSTDDVAITGYLWNFGDGSPTANIIAPLHTFTTAGVYNVLLTVQDGAGLSNTSTVIITVTNPTVNQPPVALASATPLTGTTPLAVNFTGSNSTDDVAITSYLWNFGDGSTTVSLSNPTHTYTSAGTYTALLTVTDAGGLQDTKNVVITVTSPPPPVNNFVLRVNAGGPAVTHNGILFEADKNFTGGNSYVNNLAQISELYKTERSSSSQIFGYNIPLPNGDYTVVLHFAEIYWGATGSGSGPLGTGRRKFDVTMEGTLILDNFDIFAEVGAQTAITKSYLVTVTDGVLNLSFSSLASVGGVDQPKLSALEIIGLGSSSSSKIEVNSAKTVDNESTLNIDSEIDNLRIGTNEIRLFPNPTNYEVHIAVGADAAEINIIQLFDINGKLVSFYNVNDISVGPSYFKVNVEGLEEGSYVMIFKTNLGKSYSKQLIIRK